METAYELKYYFECGSGVCLWSRNSKAEDTFGLAVDHYKLPISGNTKVWLSYLIAWYDTSLDWDNAPNTGAHWEQSEDEFYKAVNMGFKKLYSDLAGQGFIVKNSMKL